MPNLNGYLSPRGTATGYLSNVTLRGIPVELRISGTVLQWKYEDEDTWTDLIELNTLDYESMKNLPMINGVQLTGNKSIEELGIARRNEGVSSITRNGTTFTVTRPDGSSFTFTQQDTTYNDATTIQSGLMSSSDKIKLNGIASGAEVNQNAFSNMKVGVTTLTADKKMDTLEFVGGANVILGVTPNENKVMIASHDTTYSDATTSESGLMSATDKTKLDGIESGAEANQNTYSKFIFNNGSSAYLLEAGSKTDVFQFKAGDNVSLMNDLTQQNTVIISANDTTYNDATQSTHGLMSAIDKTKLDSISEGANSNIIESVAVNGAVRPVTNKMVNIVVPTAVSDLNNDLGYLTEESDPTVPSWAKQAQKPVYTASEVGALPASTKIPAKVSDLTDDSGHYTKPNGGIPKADLSSDVQTLLENAGTVVQDVSDMQDAVTGLTNRLNALADSDDTTLDQMSEIVTYIKNNKSLIDGITTGKVSVSDIVDNLNSSAANKPLSAKQGKVLKDLIDGIVIPTNVSAFTNDVGYLTSETDPTVPAWAKASVKPTYTAAEVGALPDTTTIPSKVSQLTNDSGFLTEHQDISGKANAADLSTVATSGSYNDLSNKPTIPTVPTNVSAFNNDASYANEQYVDDAITDALADIVSITYHVCTNQEYDVQTYIPTLEGASGVIYLVPKPASLIGSATVGSSSVSGNNIYYEFIYNGRSFEMIGDTQVSLDGYLEESDISTNAEVQSVITEIFGGE